MDVLVADREVVAEVEQVPAEGPVAEPTGTEVTETLIEEVSIDGMCGVY